MAQERRNVAHQVRGRFEAELEPVRSTSPIDDPRLHSDLVSHRDDAHMGHARAGWCVIPDLEGGARSHYPNPRRRKRSGDGRARSVSPTHRMEIAPSRRATAPREERANSRMKLTVSLAAQSVLRPLCLRRLPAAYANVGPT
jgi:hypothetical protein